MSKAFFQGKIGDKNGSKESLQGTVLGIAPIGRSREIKSSIFHEGQGR